MHIVSLILILSLVACTIDRKMSLRRSFSIESRIQENRKGLRRMLSSACARDFMGSDRISLREMIEKKDDKKEKRHSLLNNPFVHSKLCLLSLQKSVLKRENALKRVKKEEKEKVKNEEQNGNVTQDEVIKEEPIQQFEEVKKEPIELEDMKNEQPEIEKETNDPQPTEEVTEPAPQQLSQIFQLNPETQNQEILEENPISHPSEPAEPKIHKDPISQSKKIDPMTRTCILVLVAACILTSALIAVGAKYLYARLEKKKFEKTFEPFQFKNN